MKKCACLWRNSSGKRIVRFESNVYSSLTATVINHKASFLTLTSKIVSLTASSSLLNGS